MFSVRAIKRGTVPIGSITTKSAIVCLRILSPSVSENGINKWY
jgi:hypothetical protein